jgi:chromosome partitioning protein
VIDEVRTYFGSRVYDTIIPRTVRLSEAPGYGKPISLYDPTSKGAMAYRWLAEEVVERPVDESPLDAEQVTPAKIFTEGSPDTDDPAQGGDES